MKIVIIVPTYNELENIKLLAPAIDEQIKKVPNHEILVLVVDGNSPDGTAQEVLRLSEKYPFMNLLLEEKKAGLGAAYIYAFKYAMEQMYADAVIELDADFQHDPNDIPRFIQELDNGYDYVIGSRFTKGGSIPQEWALYRKFLSYGGSWFSKIVLWIFDVNDFTSGYKASRVKGFLDSIDLDGVLSKGFAYKIDLLFKMHKQGAKFKEIPIKFGLRDRGDSKMEKNNLMDSMRVVLTLRAKESASFIKFVVVGFLGLFTDIGLFNLLRAVLEESKFASPISGFVAMLVTYTFNNFWSFGYKKITDKKKWLMTFVVYCISSYIPIAFRSFMIAFATDKFGNNFIVANITFIIGVVIGLVWNFTVYSKIIWKK